MKNKSKISDRLHMMLLAQACFLAPINNYGTQTNGTTGTGGCGCGSNTTSGSTQGAPIQNTGMGNNGMSANAEYSIEQVPAPLNFTATVANGNTKVYLGDADGLGISIGLGTSGQEFALTGANGVTTANFKEFLKSKWLYIAGYNLTVNAQGQNDLQNNILRTQIGLDGLQRPNNISNSANVSNQQFNPLLLNVCCGFFITHNTFLSFPVSGGNGETVSLLLKVGAVGAYGLDMERFLRSNPSLNCNGGTNCNQ